MLVLVVLGVLVVLLVLVVLGVVVVRWKRGFGLGVVCYRDPPPSLNDGEDEI